MIVVRPRLVAPIPAGQTVEIPARGPLRRDEVRTQRDEAAVTRPRIEPPREERGLLDSPRPLPNEVYEPAEGSARPASPGTRESAPGETWNGDR